MKSDFIYIYIYVAKKRITRYFQSTFYSKFPSKPETN